MSQLISVYIVDDLGFNVDHVKKEILALEFKVSGMATDPNVAMKEILDSESRPDILITDINMPQMNGIILARKLKAELDIEVIYMSGDNRSTIEKMIEGEFDFIQKPCYEENLREVMGPVVARILSKRGAA